MTDDPRPPTRPVLVVEDHVDSREMLAQMLKMWGYDAATATTWPEAVAMLDGGLHPRLVLLDLMLPGISGWTVLEQLRGDLRLRQIPVIVVTAVSAQVLRRQPVTADAILSKPFNYAELRHTVLRLAGEP